MICAKEKPRTVVVMAAVGWWCFLVLFSGLQLLQLAPRPPPLAHGKFLAAQRTGTKELLYEVEEEADEATGVFEETCPEKCACDLSHAPSTVSCIDVKLIRFPDNISKEVEHLDLSNNLITELDFSINEFTKLQHLILVRNRISALPKNLSGLVHLRKLDLTGNDIIDIADGLRSISQLSRLKTLYLGGNPLKELDGLKNPTLQYLNVESSGIERLKNTSLSGLPELTHLILTNNPLKEIKDPFSLKLKGLDLSKCQLGVLSSRAFQGFPELIDLRLADNRDLVYSMRSETVRHPKLQKLDVSRCNLDRPGLYGFPALTYARLSGNAIYMLPDRIFAKNRELTHLFLDGNHLERLNKSTFANLSKLQVLDLSSNGLKSVPNTAFRENIELQFLNLSDNFMTEFPKLFTSAMSLDLSSNRIQRIEPNSLSAATRLFHLNLSKNLIEEMPSGLDSSNLRSLILRSNRISSLDNVSMSNLPELEKLDLSDNMLRRDISPEIFFDNPNLRQINLQGNLWHCDCDQLSPSWIYLSRLGTKSESLVCHTPVTVSGDSWKKACSSEWNKVVAIGHKTNRKTWGLVLVSLLTLIVCAGTIVSIRHSVHMKRVRSQRAASEREVQERLRLLQMRSAQAREERRDHVEPRIHPMELINPPSYEEAVSMPRLARSLDALNSVNENIRTTNEANQNSVARMTASSESLRPGKKRRIRRVRKLRSQSEDNLARREQRREERLRRERSTSRMNLRNKDEEEENEENRNNNTQGTESSQTAAPKVKKVRTKTGTSTDDEDSDAPKINGTKRIGKTVIRNLNREPKSGYRPSTDDSESHR
ncbi:leucine-rich repeat receptor protein kinase EMS1 isoform X2 [Trichogramma pretiosum]|uniref:leucine-rich repeat receptor protein kinase EMS1 isoform X2 n=1 Tax=Trichogramma pretiosum TaxID=7493 RepID=UPI000C718B26|nr:leucine-rich repeat receptor protein kinase EMS1 isoform X2 [Trichogramma pretiosum]